MKQKIAPLGTAPLDSLLFRMKQTDQTLVVGDIYDAMNSAVELAPSDLVLSCYKETPAQERCSLLLEEYLVFLKNLDVKDPASVAYENFATAVADYPSRGDPSVHYKIWRPVLDQYQEQHNLQRSPLLK